MAIKMSWARAQPSKATFSIKPIRELALRYIGDGHGWADPYAGDNSPCEFTNDIDTSTKALNHMDALDFCLALVEEGYGPFNGIVYDPPYSRRQISEHYRAAGRRATSLDTSDNFYNRTKNALCDHVCEGGFAISCGWHTNGFGINRGFERVEILDVAHGSCHYDTLVTVERRVA